MKKCLFILLLFLWLPCSAEAAPLWKTDALNSHLMFSGLDSGDEFSGQFDRFTTHIQFDPADLASSSIQVTVDMGSAVTGDSTRDGALPSSDWFNVVQFPQAFFQSTAITSLDPTHFEAQGTLTILGVKKDITLPFTLEIHGHTAKAEGKITLKRLDFGIGRAVDDKGDTVSNDIVVKFDINAHR